MAVEGEGSLENGGWRLVYILADTWEVHWASCTSVRPITWYGLADIASHVIVIGCHFI